MIIKYKLYLHYLCLHTYIFNKKNFLVYILYMPNVWTRDRLTSVCLLNSFQSYFTVTSGFTLLGKLSNWFWSMARTPHNNTTRILLVANNIKWIEIDSDEAKFLLLKDVRWSGNQVYWISPPWGYSSPWINYSLNSQYAWLFSLNQRAQQLTTPSKTTPAIRPKVFSKESALDPPKSPHRHAKPLMDA